MATADAAPEGLWEARAAIYAHFAATGQAPTTPGVVPGATEAPAAALPKVGPLAPGQRWSVARKRGAVLRLLRGESAELLSRGVILEDTAQGTKYQLEQK